mgnify:CR=1 FL=1
MSKTLVAYFSHSGNSQVIAKEFARVLNGDLFEIKARHTYSSQYNTVVEEAKRELNAKARPALVDPLPKLEEYDRIVIGYPNWWGTMPMPCFTFLESADFSHKTIIPFCTHEGSGMGRSEQDLQNLCSSARVLKGLAIRGSTVLQARQSIMNYLKENQLI